MIHWKPRLVVLVALALVAIASLGGGIHWESAFFD